MADGQNTAGGPLLVNGEALRLEVTPPNRGGGTKYDPQTAEQARTLLTPMVRRASEQAQQLPEQLRADRLYVEARLLPNYIAASNFPGDLLSAIGAVPVGSRADQGTYRTKKRAPRTVGTRRLVLSIDDSGLEKLNVLLERGGRTKEKRQAVEQDLLKFDDITLSHAVTITRDDDTTLWEAVLHPEPGLSRNTMPASEDVLGKWMRWIESLGGEVNPRYVRRVGGLTFTSVALPKAAAGDAARFNPLRVMRPMPVIRPFPGLAPRAVDPFQAPASSAPRSEIFRVAVFDGGLGEPTTLFPDPCINLTPEDAHPHGVQHGTAVTGAALYGLAEIGGQAATPALGVDSYRILPTPADPNDPEGYWVLDQIRDVITEGEHKLVNLSLGPSEAVVEDQEPNLWTSTLDHLAWENDVLFVVAAGNHGEMDAITGLNRVEAPADMANGISVGAVDRHAPHAKWARASYSSIGPGRQGNRLQPSCVQFGGTDDNPFPILRSNGDIAYSQGTSFAAPLVTHALSDLATQLPNPTSSALRAFVAHFAERHPHYKARQNEFGHGRLPLTFRDVLATSADEAHVLYVDQIAREEIIGYQVPVPVRFTGAVEVRITAAFMTSVEPSEPTDYTQGTLDLTFRPHAHLFNFTPPKGTNLRTVIHDQRTPEAHALLEQGWTQSGAPCTRGLGAGNFMPEHQLRDEGKWETLRHARIKFNPGEVEDPWLELTYLARRAGALDRGPSELPFAVLISVEDLNGSGTLYQGVVDQFAALRPVARVQAQTQVRIR